MTLREFFKSQQVDLNNLKSYQCSKRTYGHDETTDADTLRALGQPVQYLVCPKPVTLSTVEGITVSSQIISMSQRLVGIIMERGDDEDFKLVDEAEITAYTTDEGKVGLGAICPAKRQETTLKFKLF